MFEKAARLHLRFPYRGSCTAEDLWDLPVADLDELYRDLHAELQQSAEVGLLENPTAENEEIALKLDIIRHVFDVKMKEKAEAKSVAEKAARKRHLLAILANKQDEELQGKSAEEIRKMIDEL